MSEPSVALTDEELGAKADTLAAYFTDAMYLAGFTSKPRDINYLEEKPRGMRDARWQGTFSLARPLLSEEERKTDVSGAKPERQITRDIFNGSDKPNGLLAAYLGLAPLPKIQETDAEYTAAIAQENAALELYFPQDTAAGHSLTEDQKMALHKALHLPISIIQGPPGTGKTEVIMHIIALALKRGETVAMVSANNAAVANVIEKAKKSLLNKNHGDTQHDYAYACAMSLAALGNCNFRGVFNKAHGFDNYTKRRGKKSAEGKPLEKPVGFCVSGREAWMTITEFVKGEDGYPLVTSSIHSIRNTFADGYEKKYDLLIMDEASQANILLGIIALSCAKRAVIVGDEKQLPPVVPDRNLAAFKTLSLKYGIRSKDEAAPKSPYDLSRPDFSFFRVLL